MGREPGELADELDETELEREWGWPALGMRSKGTLAISWRFTAAIKIRKAGYSGW